jgi:hypothetical protein
VIDDDFWKANQEYIAIYLGEQFNTLYSLQVVAAPMPVLLSVNSSPGHYLFTYDTS